MILPSNKRQISLYVHWPFCLSKCPYCDFNSHTFSTIAHQQWQDAYLKQLESFAYLLEGKNIESIFFGGGTPSLMQAQTIAAIIDKVSQLAILSDTAEITMEANPTSVESGKFADFKSAGINRMSLGVQSFDAGNLKFLGRTHSNNEAIRAIEIAAKYFSNYSFDLIYGLPNQSLASWRSELEMAISLASNHISLYQLTIEKGTPFYAHYRKKQFSLPDHVLAAELYELTEEILIPKGYARYEISNYARPNFSSKHNRVYWNYGDYLGIGPGAHSRISFPDDRGLLGMQAVEMIYNPQKWLEEASIQTQGIKQLQILTSQEIITEILMMGLRLSQGITNAQLMSFCGKDFLTLIKPRIISDLLEQNLLQIQNDLHSLTHSGLALHSSIVIALMQNIIY